MKDIVNSLVLVTGATGAVGPRVVRALANGTVALC